MITGSNDPTPNKGWYIEGYIGAGPAWSPGRKLILGAYYNEGDILYNARLGVYVFYMFR